MNRHHVQQFFWLKLATALILMLLLLAWKPYVEPQLLKLPVNYSYEADLISYDNLYDTNKNQYTGSAQSDSTFRYEVIDSSNSAAYLVKNVFDVRTERGEPIFSADRTYGINPENKQHVPEHGDEPRSGYLFGPTEADKSAFTYWHVNYNQPLTMQFQDEDTILGLVTNRYQATFTADQTSNLAHLPDVGTTKGITLDVNLTLWIEPATGYLVKYEDNATAYYYDLKTKERLSPWNQFSNQYSFDSIVAHVKEAQSLSQETAIIHTVIPPVIMLFIAFLASWCALDLRRMRRWAINRAVLAVSAGIITISAIIVMSRLLERIASIGVLRYDAGPHPAASACFIILGVCACFIVAGRQRRHRVKRNIRIALGFVLLITATALIGYVLGLKAPPFDIDSMTPVTSLGLFLLSSATYFILLPEPKVHPLIPQLLIGVAIIASTVSLTVLAYNLNPPSYAVWLKETNFSTALLLLIQGIVLWGVYALTINNPKRAFAQPLAFAFIFVLSGALITGVVWKNAKDNLSRNETLGFASDINKIESLMTQRLDSYISALISARSLFDASNEVTRDEWRSYVDGLQLAKNYPGTQGIGYAAVIPASEKERIEQTIRNEGYSNFALFPTNPPRDLYTAIVYIEPFDARNQRAFGYDMFTQSTRRNAMERARDSAAPTMSGKVTLIQETSTDVQPGFLLYLPRYKKGTVNRTPEERRKNIEGYLYSPIRMNNFMKATVGNQSGGIAITIYDSSTSQELKESDLLYQSHPTFDASSARLIKNNQIQVADHIWTATFASLPDYSSATASGFPSFILGSGLGISLLLGAVIFSFASSRQRALSLAATITSDLQIERNDAVRLQQKDKAILGGIGEGLILFSADGTIERVNSAAQKMLGFSEEELIGSKYTTALTAVSKDGKPMPLHTRPTYRALQGGHAVQSRLQYKRKNGTDFPVDVNVAPIITHKRVSGIVEIFRDVAEEENLNRSKDEFISLASHQLRTPLTASKWYAEMLLENDVAEKLQPKQKQIIKKIQSSNDRLAELVVSLLNLTRVESGRLLIRPQPTDLTALVENTVEILQPKLQEKKQRIEITSVGKLPLVQLDPALIRQVLLNLLTNASKYSPEDSLIAITLKIEGASIICDIIDHGYGIPEKQKSQIFEKFFRGENITTKETGGTGLGLYLVKKILEISGGTIRFRDTKGGGTTFTFTLPKKGMKAKEGKVVLEE